MANKYHDKENAAVQNIFFSNF